LYAHDPAQRVAPSFSTAVAADTSITIAIINHIQAENKLKEDAA
jgi:hypothetical protein